MILRQIYITLIFCLSLFGIGCSSKISSEKVKQLEMSTPQGFSATVGEYKVDQLDDWWNVFDDPELNILIENMFKNNYVLEETYTALEIKRVSIKSASSERLPTINAGAGGQTASREMSGSRSWHETYELSAKATWELDIWGKEASKVSAAEFDAAKAEMALKAKYLSLTAELADRYFLYLYETERLEHLIILEKLYEKLVSADKDYFRTGLGTLEDIYESEKKLESSRIAIAQSETTIMSLREDIALLLGVTGSSLNSITSGWKVKLPQLPFSIPAEAIARRADVKEAEYDIYRSDRELAAAISDRYPSLSLSANAVYSAETIPNLIRPESFVFSLIADTLFTVFDGGRKRTVVQIRELELDSYISRYKQSVLNALADIEKGFLNNAYKERSLNELRNTEIKNNGLFELGKLRFQGGLIPLRSVVSAEISLREQQLAVLQGERELVSARIGLIRALGGGWEDKYIETLGARNE